MPAPPPERRWPAIVAGYLALVVVLAIVTVQVSLLVDPLHRVVVARIAAAVLLGVVLLHVRAVVRETIEAEPDLPVGAAGEARGAEPVFDRAFERFEADVRISMLNQRYFDDVLWPRLLALDRRPSRSPVEPLMKPGPRRRFRRGPSLEALRDLVTALERRASAGRAR